MEYQLSPSSKAIRGEPPKEPVTIQWTKELEEAHKRKLAKQNRELDSESWEQAKGLIALLYNFVLIVLWFYFDYMLCHELNKYGLARAKVRPKKYLVRTIYALKVV